MINISKEKLDKLVEKDSLDNKLDKLVGFMAKAFVPVVSAEILLVFLLRPMIHPLISILLFAVIDILLPLILSFSMVFIISFVKIRKVAGGTGGAIKVFRDMKRTKNYYRLFNQEICSDAVLTEAEALVGSAKKKEGYAYIAALARTAECHCMRCEFEQARIIIYELRELPKKDHISRNDYLVAALQYSTTSNDDLFFRETVAEYIDIIESIPERDPSLSDALLSIAAYEQKINGNYDKALEYIDWESEYRERKQKAGTYTNAVKLSNFKLYNNAALHLDKAEVLMLKGDMQGAEDELRSADEKITKITCEIPPIFQKERGELVSLLTILP